LLTITQFQLPADENIGNADNIDNMDPVCDWGEYGPWSLCSVTCGEGTQHRSRQQLFAPKSFEFNNNNNNNNKCDSNEQIDKRKCQIGPCQTHSKLMITA
jgi:hypothetical protein